MRVTVRTHTLHRDVVVVRADEIRLLGRNIELKTDLFGNPLSCLGILVFVVVVFGVLSHCVVSESALHRLEPTVVMVARFHANPTQAAVVCGHQSAETACARATHEEA